MIKFTFTCALLGLVALSTIAQTTFQSNFEYDGDPIRIMDIEGEEDDVLVVGHSMKEFTPFETNELKVFTVSGDGVATDAINIELDFDNKNFVIFNCAVNRLKEDEAIIGCSSGVIDGIGITKILLWINMRTRQHKIYQDSTSQVNLENVLVEAPNGFSEWRIQDQNLEKTASVCYQYGQIAAPSRTIKYVIDNADLSIPKAAVKINDGSVVGLIIKDLKQNGLEVRNESCIMKLDDDGNVIQSYSYQEDLINDLTKDLDDNIYAHHVGGTVIKFDKDLRMLWARQIVGGTTINYSKIYVDGIGNLVFAGPADKGIGTQSNRTMKLDPSGNLIMQKVMLDLAQRKSLGVTPLGDHIVSFGVLNTPIGLDFYRGQ